MAVCARCGRNGSRGYVTGDGGAVRCASETACRRRRPREENRPPTIEEWADKLAAEAPPLGPRQRERLASLLDLSDGAR